ncbi:hypothetical protein L1987_70163 [Smallanthus sonchifolius]|uniref:Uncharacterized protein n=1 Tax=Smallanthus sonchifolius TaxID=185202 RepID=A0ACB9APQ9_9ASTR|nr:hypothetical protein L1987_70163 [Smallanthus sonchifolius]
MTNGRKSGRLAIKALSRFKNTYEDPIRIETDGRVHAMDAASQALDVYDVVDCTSIAAHIKKHPMQIPVLRVFAVIRGQLHS